MSGISHLPLYEVELTVLAVLFPSRTASTLSLLLEVRVAMVVFAPRPLMSILYFAGSSKFARR